MSTRICPYCAEEIQAAAVRCKHCGSWLTDPSGGAGGMGVRRLTRSSTDRMLAGVCGGMAHHLGIDPTLVRITVALVTFFTALVPGILTYLIFALVVPSDDSLPPAS